MKASFNDLQRADVLRVKNKIREKLANIHQDAGFNKLPTNWTGDAFLTGGAIASIMQWEEPKDWDIYFKSHATQAWFASNYKMFKSGIADVNEKYQDFLGKDGKMVTARSITMKNGISFIIMQNMAGNPNDVRKYFDYVHCMPWYDLLNNVLYMSPVQYEACHRKLLVVNNPAVIKPYRESKFLERGYKKA